MSAYATMHPAEDWAETFAHYLHIRDALDTSAAFGFAPSGRPPTARLRVSRIRPDHRALVTALVGAEHDQPFDGPRGSLPVRPPARRAARRCGSSTSWSAPADRATGQERSVTSSFRMIT